MVKKSKWIYVIGSVIIGVSILLIAFLAVLASGVSRSLPKLVFSSGSLEKIYDGAPLVSDDWQLVSGKQKEGHQIEFVSGEGRTDVGTSPNVFTVKVWDEDGGDVTDKYNIEYLPGELTVIARHIVVGTAGATKEYDGQPLTADGYEKLGGDLVAGHELSATVFGERTDAGVSDNAFRAVVLDAGGADVTRNYYIEKQYGKLEITKRHISISTPDGFKFYDGTPLENKQWAYASETQVLDGQEITVVVTGSRTESGVGENKIGEVKITEGNKNVSSNYDVTYILGDLFVLPRQITIRSESDSKDYDGEPLTNPNYEFLSNTRIIDGHFIDVIVAGERTDPGESENIVAEVIITDGEGKNVTYNYDLYIIHGSLVVYGQIPGSSGSSGTGGTGGGDNPINIDDSGELGGLPDPEEDEIAAKVFSDIAGQIYLRLTSYGDYTGKAWTAAEEYSQTLDSQYGFNYLTGIALKNAGNTPYALSVEAFGEDYLLPYYLDMSKKNYDIQKSDVKFTGDTSRIYSAYYYMFDYISEGFKTPDLGAYKDLESAYYEYVSSKYLSVPQTTLDYFQQIIWEYGLDASNPDIIYKVADFIKNAAVYKLDYDPELDNAEDIAVSFLSEYKQGLCRHFATAATLMFRALGLPARYTIGYAGNVQHQQWTNVYTSQAHAWVEVYLKGIGWIQVEVTGAGASFDDDGGDGSGGGGGGTGDSFKIKPLDLSMQYYNGAVLEANGENHVIQGLKSFTEIGYTYKAVVTGKQATAGIGYSTIVSFALFDPAGKDVTSEYTFIFGKGKLHLYIREISIKTGNLTKIYDGSTLFPDDGGGEIIGSLFAGHRVVSLKLTGSQSDVGQSENSCSIKISDEDGIDVTELYKINKSYGTLTVKAREITVKVHSATKIYDGTALTYPSFDIVWEGDGQPLVLGDSAAIEIEGSQTNPGRSSNEVVSAVIIAKNGKDVTSNYSIKYISGLLEVTR